MWDSGWREERVLSQGVGSNAINCVVELMTRERTPVLT